MVTAQQAQSSSVRPVRVLLVDDHEMLTEALSARLASAPDMWVVGRCTTEDTDLPGLAALLRPDVITIELVPASDAAALLARFRAAWPPAHLVVLTASRNNEQAIAAARAGADGWVSKESSVETLAHVLRTACRGHAWFPPEQLGPILRELRADVHRAHHRDGPLDALTGRERAVLLGLVKGCSAVEIATELGVTANTVRTHTNKLFHKLGVHSRLEAVSVARAAGMRQDRAAAGPYDATEPTGPGEPTLPGEAAGAEEPADEFATDHRTGPDGARCAQPTSANGRST